MIGTLRMSDFTGMKHVSQSAKILASGEKKQEGAKRCKAYQLKKVNQLNFSKKLLYREYKSSWTDKIPPVITRVTGETNLVFNKHTKEETTLLAGDQVVGWGVHRISRHSVFYPIYRKENKGRK